MPVVEVDPDELRELTSHDEKSDDELIDDMFALGLELEGRTEDDELELEFAPDRLDRLSVEGIARSLRYQYGDDRGVYVPSITDADWTIEVDADVPAERPYVTGAVLRDVNLDREALDSLIQLQEKLHATMGRTRVKGAIGVHDLTMLKGAPATDDAGRGQSVRYTGIDADEDTFVPLEGDAELTPGEALSEHHMAKEYADLVESYERMPAIYDDIGLFSFPPVINGRRTEVTTDSRDLFVEMTGTDQWTIDRMLAIVCYAMDARGATVEAVDVEYADDASGDFAGHTLERPDLSTTRKTVAHERVESIVGVDFGPEEVIDLLERSGLDAEQVELDDARSLSTDAAPRAGYEVDVPAYRVDVLHPRDLIDDVGRAYGFDDLEPEYPDVSTVGGRHERSRHERAVRETLVGLGFEDMLNFHMTSEGENFERMRLPIPEVESVDLQTDSLDVAGYGGEHADRDLGHPLADDAPVGFDAAPTIGEPYSEDYTIVRTWALPSLVMVLEGNTHREYPQDLAEVGFVAGVDPTEETGVHEHHTVAAVLARHDASYEDARGRLQALARSFDADLETPPTEHPSFLDGRAAEIVIDGDAVGVIGELHPEVLVEHDLEVPVAGFELRLDALE